MSDEINGIIARSVYRDDRDDIRYMLDVRERAKKAPLSIYTGEDLLSLYFVMGGKDRFQQYPHRDQIEQIDKRLQEWEAGN